MCKSQKNTFPGKYPVQQYNRVLYLIACQQLNCEDAKEAVQETNTRYLFALQENQLITNEKAFLLGILRYVIKEIQRDAKKYRNELREGIDQGKQIEDRLIRQEEIAIIRDCVNKLEPFHQKLLTLHCIEEKSFTEMENILKIPHSTLHRKFNKCLKIFGKILRKSGISSFLVSLLLGGQV